MRAYTRTLALATGATVVWILCVAAAVSLGQAVWLSNLSRGDAMWVCVYLSLIVLIALGTLIRAAMAVDDYLDYRAIRREYLKVWKARDDD